MTRDAAIRRIRRMTERYKKHHNAHLHLTTPVRGFCRVNGLWVDVKELYLKPDYPGDHYPSLRYRGKPYHNCKGDNFFIGGYGYVDCLDRNAIMEIANQVRTIK